MIELGKITIKDERTIVEARNKIRILAEDLEFDSISVTRIATMTSEISRRMAASDQASNISVGLDRREGALGLVLEFTSNHGHKPEQPRAPVFDDIEKIRIQEGLESIKTFKFLPDPKFEPTEVFINKKRELVQRLTKEELYAKLRESYEKLDQSTAKLMQAEKMSGVGTLVAGVAHELNNPIMGILNFVQYCLKHTAREDKRYAVLKDAEQEAGRSSDIVRNLLTFSRMEQEGQEEYEKESLSVIFDRVLKLLSYRVEKENISVTRNIAKGTPKIWMKINNIQQVVFNLFNNALDSLDKGKKKEVHVDIHREGESVQLVIADTGSGIPPEKLQKIFDPFFTTKPVGEGTGLGLSICHSIVKSHGGEILCESELGKGTTFRVLLPIERRQD